MSANVLEDWCSIAFTDYDDNDKYDNYLAMAGRCAWDGCKQVLGENQNEREGKKECGSYL